MRASSRLIVSAACLCWTVALAYNTVLRTPHPLAPRPFVDWDQTRLVGDVAPWMMLPFLALAAWGIAFSLRVRSVSDPPRWVTWATGAAALSWTVFVLWRAHDQAFTCAVWAPSELLQDSSTCSLPRLLLSVLPWLVLPVASWLVLAARRNPPIP